MHVEGPLRRLQPVKQFTDGSTYIYVSNDASHGATSHWTAATTPALADGTEFRSVAFAPDGLHGWIVGATGDPQGPPHFFTTADGGAAIGQIHTSTIAALATEKVGFTRFTRSRRKPRVDRR